MNTKKCKNTKCENLVISFSDYCGKHTKSSDVKKRLKSISSFEINDINLHKIKLSKVTLSSKVFSYPLFNDCEFISFEFIQCKFFFADFTHTIFDECRFVDCHFEEVNATDTQWMNCIFINCVFDKSIFNQCFFDNTKASSCDFNTIEFIGHFFGDTGPFEECNFDTCIFTQSSINQSIFDKCNFESCDFIKTTLYDSSFINSYFKNVTNDFKDLGGPTLCDFRNSKFIKTYLPRSAKKWNNFNKENIDYYLSMVDVISDVVLVYPSELSDLTVVLIHLNKLHFQITNTFKERIHELYRFLLENAAKKGDYEVAGDIINEYGKVPFVFRKGATFVLPPPTNPEEELDSMYAKLYIRVTLPKWSLQSVSKFILLLSKIENQIPNYTPQLIKGIQQGSLSATIFGDLRQLLLTGRILDVEKLEIEIDKLEATFQKELLEIQHKKIELEYLSEEKKLELESKRLSIMKQKLEILDMLEKKLGVDYKKYAQSEEGQIALSIAEEIKVSFPILKLKLTESQGNK